MGLRMLLKYWKRDISLNPAEKINLIFENAIVAKVNLNYEKINRFGVPNDYNH
jgi:hypothetical protein